MTDHDPIPKSIDKRTAVEKIEDALQNPVYFEYAFEHPNPFARLIEDDIDPSVRETQGFRDLKQIVGWPGENDDGSESQEDRDILPPHNYEPLAFMTNIFEAPASSPKALDHLLHYFRAVPADFDKDGVMTSESRKEPGALIYGSAPFLIRAHAVAPDLMQGLHETFKSTTSEEAERIFLENPLYLQAAYMAYRIMGYLVKADDTRRQFNNVLRQPLPEDPSLITSSHQAINGG